MQSGIVIGFANTMYTMWRVSEPYQVRIGQYATIVKQDFNYIQNLSTDLEKAKIKVMKFIPNTSFTIDVSLSGGSSFTTQKTIHDPFEDYQFTRGLFNRRKDIRESTSVTALRDGYENEQEPQKTYCFNRLVELGALKEYKGEWLSEYEIENKQHQELQATYKTGYHFTDKEKITIDVTVLNKFSFDSPYGLCWIMEMITPELEVFKYLGNNPPLMFEGKTYKITGIVKHSMYNDKEETRLNRIKIV